MKARRGAHEWRDITRAQQAVIWSNTKEKRKDILFFGGYKHLYALIKTTLIRSGGWHVC
ncbi:hypothetical protein [Candidatus Raskinella chloraquaticus]|uniref:hypothetical protein n=1 Tax=Candidatus Raskinella chloraquaticus TaxID=1951219 RepID=UPI003671FD9C